MHGISSAARSCTRALRIRWGVYLKMWPSAGSCLTERSVLSAALTDIITTGFGRMGSSKSAGELSAVLVHPYRFERFVALAPKYPRLREALENDCRCAVLILWRSYYMFGREKRRARCAQFSEASAFIRQHPAGHAFLNRCGKAERLVLKPAAHDATWSLVQILKASCLPRPEICAVSRHIMIRWITSESGTGIRFLSGRTIISSTVCWFSILTPFERNIPPKSSLRLPRQETGCRSDQLQYDLDCVHNSVSFRVGRVITWAPRKLRGGVRCLKEHGVAYTVNRFFEHIRCKH